MVNWFSRFITSSIGKKLIMSLTGLFLIVFLLVHLVGNLQLLAGDGGQAFNEYAYFMTNNRLVTGSIFSFCCMPFRGFSCGERTNRLVARPATP
jgi:succinate dehydrogenase/fumarate reductase cytochrome b subunit